MRLYFVESSKVTPDVSTMLRLVSKRGISVAASLRMPLKVVTVHASVAKCAGLFD